MRRPDVPAALATGLCILWALHPGDVSFIGDEPMLIENAMRANLAGVLADHGLRGTKGVVYGPLPTWIYQGLLHVSHDPVLWVVLRALFCGTTVAVALFRLADVLGLWRGFVPVVLCSPYLWYYSRVLWDNSFAIPTSALGFAAYVTFLRDGRSTTLALVIACMAALALTHLMAIAIIAPLVAHAIVFRGRAIARRWRTAVPCAAVAMAVTVPYARILARSRPTAIDPGGLDAWLFPLEGARILGASGLETIFGTGWMAAGGAAVVAAGRISLLAMPASAAGVAIAIAAVSRRCRRHEDPLRAHACGLAIAVVGAQVLLAGMTNAAGFVHYFNATWIAFALFVWLAVDALASRPPLAPAVAAVQGIAALSMLLFVAIRIHHVHPSRESYGATLANQLAVARELERRGAPERVSTDVQQVRRFPVALRTLRALVRSGPVSGRDEKPARVTYARNDPLDGRITVVFGVRSSWPR